MKVRRKNDGKVIFTVNSTVHDSFMVKHYTFNECSGFHRAADFEEVADTWQEGVQRLAEHVEALEQQIGKPAPKDRWLEKLGMVPKRLTVKVRYRRFKPAKRGELPVVEWGHLEPLSLECTVGETLTVTDGLGEMVQLEISKS